MCQVWCTSIQGIYAQLGSQSAMGIYALCYIYIKRIWCNGFPDIYVQLEEGVKSICYGYMCIVHYMKLLWCNGFPEIYAQLEEGGGVNLPLVYVHYVFYMSQAWKRVWKRDNKVQTLSNIWDNQCGCPQMCR